MSADTPVADLGLVLLALGWSTLTFLSLSAGKVSWALFLVLALILILNIAPVVVPD